MEKFDSSIKKILPCLKIGGTLKTDVFKEIKSTIESVSRVSGKKRIGVGRMLFEVENTPYYFNKGIPSDNIGRVLTFTRIK